MARLEWTEEFRLDVKVVDRQHRRLVELINELDEALVAGNSGEILKGIFGELELYITHHFGTEERLFQSMGLDDFPRHQEEHRSFTDNIEALRRDYVSADEAAHRVMEYLADWLVDHILEKDKNALDHIRETRQELGQE